MNPLHHPSLKDRVAVITGGGRGFGWFIAEELLKAGAKVVATASRHPDQLTDVQKKADALAGPGRFITFKADVRDYADCEATVALTLKTFGRIDVLVNNAGRGTGEYRMGLAGKGSPRFWDVPVDGWKTIIDTNLTGVFNMTRATIPHMMERKFGKIFSISTSLTTMSAPGLSPYGASKAGLEMSHVIWAKELKDTGVDVNILLPGGASDTPFITQDMSPGDVGKRANLLPGDVIVPPAVWLCADATNGLTGRRIIAKFWDKNLPPEQAFAACLQPKHDLPEIM
ncbi:MAG: SDR family oxidoreductase [Rhodospirillaceae bacterium]|nr:SDR family oxidoreductase [Rhodospirillaceae bacterium]